MAENFHLGYFLKQSHIEKAIALLNFQLEQSSPLYNNLDFSLYRQIDLAKIDASEFYRDYIEKDALYYFEDLFYVSKYFSIQRAYKIREFHYLSLHMMIVYYALGMYIKELLNVALQTDQTIYHNKPVHVYYGGKLNEDQPRSSRIFYYEDYKDFLLKKEEATTPEEGKKIFAISLDIKNFFYSINHWVLLDIIGTKAGSVARAQYNFDDDTKKSITFLLELLQNGSRGVPVSNQNLVSSFLSLIYLSTLDNFVLAKFINSPTTACCYLRYVDDFYLILKTDDSADDTLLRNTIYDTENMLSLFLMDKLQLSVSTEKSKRFEIRDAASQLEFMQSSNLDSPFDQDFDYDMELPDSILKLDIAGKPVPEVFNHCIDTIAVLKAQAGRLQQLSMEIKDAAYLNYVLIHKGCLAYSRSPAAAAYIDGLHIFDNITAIDYLLIKPKVMLHLITIRKKYRDELVQFLTEGFKSGSSIVPKLTLLDKYIHQMNFLISETKDSVEQAALKKELTDNGTLFLQQIEQLKAKRLVPQIEYMELLIAYLKQQQRPVNFNPIYDASFLNDEYSVSLMQQIKLRRLSEGVGNYSVSLNHFINEFQNLFGIRYFNRENKTALEISQEMSSRTFDPDHIALISDFFKRRNENSVSHPNMIEIGLWSVHKTEYYDTYKEPVYRIIELIYHNRH